MDDIERKSNTVPDLELVAIDGSSPVRLKAYFCSIDR